MAVAIGRINSFVQFLGQRHIRFRLDELHDFHAALRRLSTAELQHRAELALEGREFEIDLPARSFIARIGDSLPSLVADDTIQNATLKRIALASAMFERFPADLPEGSALFPQQMQAAMALTQRSLVQMDTGEGKTYAILPAGFAQCCRYNRVYILCPNDYLARRDATRTRPFWNALGIEVGLGLGSVGDWSRRVIYTTLRAVMSHHLSNEIAARPAEAPITFGAAILDEADAILLDEANRPYSRTLSVPSSIYDWDLALKVAELLTEGEDISVDHFDMTASLTLAGERKIAEATDVSSLPASTQLVFRLAVEHAFIARSVALEGVHYIRDGYSIHVLDLATGSIQRGLNALWLSPLRALLGMDQIDGAIPLHSIQPRVLLKYFDCISGLSGTLQSDALEYLASYQLPTLVLPPLKPRQDGEQQNHQIFTTREVAHVRAVELVHEAIEAGRPVLVGTQTFREAGEFHQRLLGSNIDANLHLITELRPIEEVSEIIDGAGAPGSVLVGAQMVGRGLDIRLTPEAHAAGGLFLLGLGVPGSDRSERQFLGRAGRQGDPWSRVFVSHLEEGNFPNAGGMISMLNRMGHEPHEAIEHPWIDNALKTRREIIARATFDSRRRQEPIEATTRDVRARIRNWFEHVQAFSFALEAKAESPAAFLGWLTELWCERNFQPLAARSGRPSQTAAAALVDEVAKLYARAGIPCTLNPLALIGKSVEDIETAVCDHLKGDLVRLVVAAHEEMRNAVATVTRAQQAYSELPSRTESLFRRASRMLRPENAGSGALERVAAGPEWLPASEQAGGADLDDVASKLEVLAKEVAIVMQSSIPGTQRCEDLQGFHSEVTEAARSVEELQLVSKQFAEYARRVERSPLEIASWTLQLGWSGFLDREEQIRHQTAQEQLSEIDTPQILRDRLFKEWQEFEADVSRGMLSNLIAAGSPEKLDDLFSLRDSAGASTRTFEEVNHALPAPEEADGVRQANAEIEQFLSGNRASRLKAGAIEDKATLLRHFLQFAPLHKLRSPTQISEALTGWADLEEKLRVPRRFRAMHKDWISALLVELNTRGRIGPVPYAARPGLFTQLSQLRLRDLDFSSMMLWSSFLILAVSFPLLSLITTMKWPSEQGIPRLIEWLMFGPLLEQGSFAAPAIAGIGTASLASAVLYSKRRAGYEGSAKLEQWIMFAAAACVTTLIGWRLAPSDAWSLMSVVVFTVLAVYYAGMAAQCVWTIENLKGINLVYAGLVTTAASLLWSDVFERSLSIAPAVVTIVVATGFIALRLFNVAYIPILGVRITSVQLDSRTVESIVRVRPNLSVKAHFFSLVLALATKGLAAALVPLAGLSGEAASYFAKTPGVAMYVLSLCLFAHRGVSDQFSMRRWDLRLNKSRQFIKDHDSPAMRREFLVRVKRRLLRRECTVYLALGTFAALVLAGQENISLETALVAFAVSALMAEAAFQFALQVASAMRSGGTVQVDAIDMRPSQMSELPQERMRGRMVWLQRIAEEPWIIVTTLSGIAGLINYMIQYWPVIKSWLDRIFG